MNEELEKLVQEIEEFSKNHSYNFDKSKKEQIDEYNQCIETVLVDINIK